MSNHGMAYWEARSYYEEMTGRDYDKRHRSNRPAYGVRQCPCWECGRLRFYGWSR